MKLGWVEIYKMEDCQISFRSAEFSPPKGGIVIFILPPSPTSQHFIKTAFHWAHCRRIPDHILPVMIMNITLIFVLWGRVRELGLKDENNFVNKPMGYNREFGPVILLV